MVEIPKNTSNRSLIFGDFDKDGVANVDDKYPFNKRKKQQKSELLLTNELRTMRRRALEHRNLLNQTTTQLRGAGFKVRGRIKGTTSIVNKLRRKYLYTIKDFAGVMILVDNQQEAYDVLDYLQRNYNVVEVENYYKQAHRTGARYHAIHVLIEKSGNYLEVQIKTPEEYQKSQATHTQYKLSDIRT